MNSPQWKTQVDLSKLYYIHKLTWWCLDILDVVVYSDLLPLHGLDGPALNEVSLVGHEDAGPAAQLGPEVAQDPLRLLQTQLVVHREHDEEGVRGVGAHLVLHLGILRFPSHDWIQNW